MQFIETIDIPIEELRPYPGNARTHDDAALDESIRENGQYRAIVARRIDDGVQVLAGHGTADALRRAGETTVRVEIIDADDREALRVNLVDNATQRHAGYDEKALLALLDEAAESGGLVGTGWDQTAYEALIAELDEGNPFDYQDSDSDSEPTEEKEPISQIGDLWFLGNHRLLCADSLKRETWDRILGDCLADCIWTDPPYGIGYNSNHQEWAGSLINDSSPDDAIPALGIIAERMTPDAAMYLCTRWDVAPAWAGAIRNAGLIVKNMIVWEKGHGGMGDLEGAYSPYWEAILFSHHGKFHFRNGRPGDVWGIPGLFCRGFRYHPTQKPVALIRKALEDSTDEGGLIVDPFAGSATTVIAANESNRLARAIEIDPQYVDAACVRWQKVTGIKPVRESTGEAVDFLGNPDPAPAAG